MFLKKGKDPDVDSYSAFWDNKKVSQTILNEELKKKGITDVYVCGLAYDVCVGQWSYEIGSVICLWFVLL